ncbi:hypothetical protein ACFQS5_26485 [Salinirubellus sp. GCM10025899]|uniref:hypothetical protein n=1 Tax=Salinirubellus sp. GCM10025899 TaxID=3252689 RepID=UPI00360A8859
MKTHTHNGQDDQFYDPLLGNDDFDATGFQGSWSGDAIHDLAVKWRRDSADAGVPWVVCVDEPQRIELDPNSLRHGRTDYMWPFFMGGAGGFEWYVWQDGGGPGDPLADDFRRFEEILLWSGHLLEFFQEIPYWEMESDRGNSGTGTATCWKNPATCTPSTSRTATSSTSICRAVPTTSDGSTPRMGTSATAAASPAGPRPISRRPRSPATPPRSSSEDRDTPGVRRTQADLNRPHFFALSEVVEPAMRTYLPVKKSPIELSLSGLYVVRS